ncbi:anthranilate synthase component I [Corynebacterium sp. 320]|uniref:anthranilate synthase component I n=1 Tax=Corynebacterium TaxID=1716 RepID=UPI00125CC81A|nr:MULTISPECIES: anthranilate synthase component I [Corynebacterium]KAB1502539.1 anthranilate synthase component I [Corynebacterium sp. 320]KAB1551932.1 anthranilate synthase component I [Corynebacterium sp. 319]KAB3526146.1 anthranilate synthase component I [Corynebacterium sp. 250]KAB3538926.1 anthranilate synthase component I [Corynebacterium sp. 366]QNP92881.1 anthranilate synthase component I [Corynebacterium zhongnanshanii]
MTTVTSRDDFLRRARTHRVVPVVRTVLADHETALSAYRKLAAGRPGTFLLESAAHGQSWDRYSFIGTGARCALVAKDSPARWIGTPPVDIDLGDNPLEAVTNTLQALHTQRDPELPPLTSGLVGYMAYDMVRYIEDLPNTCVDDLDIPDMVQLLVEDMAVVDHHEGTIILIANAINWDNSEARANEVYDEAVERINAMVARLGESLAVGVEDFETPAPQPRRQRSLDDHKRRIEETKEHIRAGDAFQIVLSQRFEVDTTVPALDIYRMLRHSNPSPYMFLLNVPNEDFSETAFQIVGSSPESLVQVRDRQVTTFPIAGSRPRGANVEEDQLLEKELVGDEKENSEHLMLVDLGRNDLGRVSVPGTVEVHDFRHVERYSAIMHLVSGVSGYLAEDKTAVDAFAATFPAGTLSGAPKPSAMKIIDELEDSRRGVYGGTVGYFDFAGNTDQAIAIRSGVYKDGTVYVQAGGGIVADSDPDAEDLETRNKAAAVLRAVAAAETLY